MRKIDFWFAPDIQQSTICFPDDRWKTIVREDGSLNYGFRDPVPFEERKHYRSYRSQRTVFSDPAEYFSVRLRPRFTHRDTFVRSEHREEAAHVPIIHHLDLFETSALSWTIFAVRDDHGFRGDVILWELTAEEAFGSAPSRVEIHATGDVTAAPRIIESIGTTAYWTSEGLQLPGLQHYEFLTPEKSRRGVFVFCLEGSIEPKAVTEAWAEEELEKTRVYWNSLNLTSQPITVPDNDVQDMIVASARNILQAREIENGITEYKVGPTIYRSLFMVDGYFLLEAAHILGDHETAFQQGILAILRRVKPDGSIQIIPEHYKETGIAIATIVRQCELMGDDERLRELWPTVLRAVDYIRSLREEAERRGPDYPGRELFPPAYLDGGISGPYPDYTTPLWTLVGLKFARDAGERLSLPATDEIAILYDTLMDALVRSAERDIGVTDDGIPYIPMIMERRPFNRPQTATWAFAHAISPGELFPPDHAYVVDFLRLLDSVDDEQGIPKETGWIHDQAVWGYSSMFYAQAWLYAGRPDKAIDYLYAFANHASPSRVWREEQSLTGSHSAEYCGDMPHNWGSAEFIRLVRNAVVLERAGNLELLAGVPLEWLPTDDRFLEVVATPTRYGRVTARLRRNPDKPEGYLLEYHRVPGTMEPREVIVHWRGTIRNDLITVSDASDDVITVALDSSFDG